MQAIAIRDRDAGLAGLTLADLPYPHASENNVIVRVHAAGFTPGELGWAERGLIAAAGTGRRACPGTRCRVSSPNWATGPPA